MRDSGYFKSGQEQLYYAAHLPEVHDKPGEGIIFIHAGGGNRFGPHRMFVEFAESLSDKYICVRFDLSGCGDSSGICQEGTAPHQDDIISAVHHFRQRYQLNRVYLMGISRGAYLIYQILTKNELPVDGAVLLSCPVSSRKAAIDTFSLRLKGYGLKLFEIRSWKKLITGRVNIRYVIQSLLTALSLKRRYSPDSNPEGKHAADCPMLFVYGQHDPICAASMEFYRRDCRRCGITWKQHVIPLANHSFFHYDWKAQLYQVLTKWLHSHRIDYAENAGKGGNAIVSE
jgi:pimeloyl-ACP methyl ester carboxylesterase